MHSCQYALRERHNNKHVYQKITLDGIKQLPTHYSRHLSEQSYYFQCMHTWPLSVYIHHVHTRIILGSWASQLCRRHWPSPYAWGCPGVCLSPHPSAGRCGCGLVPSSPWPGLPELSGGAGSRSRQSEVPPQALLDHSVEQNVRCTHKLNLHIHTMYMYIRMYEKIANIIIPSFESVQQ